MVVKAGLTDVLVESSSREEAYYLLDVIVTARTISLVESGSSAWL